MGVMIRSLLGHAVFKDFGDDLGRHLVDDPVNEVIVEVVFS
jgi:hypothetical protein